jgi:hypothetical protein
MERALLLLLKPRDRETISGDLLEEYREEQLPMRGRARANYWYLGQLNSFASARIREGGAMKQLLMLMCVFTVAAGIWLGVMESLLRHEGYAGRIVVAAFLAVQSLVTVLVVLLNAGRASRVAVLVGAVAIAALGARAVWKIAQAEHFEGFVLVIGVALMVQAGLTLATLIRPHAGARTG